MLYRALVAYGALIQEKEEREMHKRTALTTLCVLCLVMFVLVFLLGGCTAVAPAAEAPAAEEPAAEAAAPSEVRLEFWIVDSEYNDAVQERVQSFENDFGYQVDMTIVPGSDMTPKLTSATEAGLAPDVVECFTDQTPLCDNSSPWMICYSRLIVTENSAYPSEAAQLVNYLGGEHVCELGLPISWVPYNGDPPMELIGHATLTPGDPVIGGAVAEFKKILVDAGATINLARAVQLTDENGEIHLAPVGTSLDGEEKLRDQEAYYALAAEQGIVFGIVVLSNSVDQSRIPDGAYLLREKYTPPTDTSSEGIWRVEFVNSEDKLVYETDAVTEEVTVEPEILRGFLSAGVFRRCRHCHYFLGIPIICHTHECS